MGWARRQAHSKEVEHVSLLYSAGLRSRCAHWGAQLTKYRPTPLTCSKPDCMHKAIQRLHQGQYLGGNPRELRLLVSDIGVGPSQVQQFSLEQGGPFVEATPQQGVQHRTTGF